MLGMGGNFRCYRPVNQGPLGLFDGLHEINRTCEPMLQLLANFLRIFDMRNASS